MAQNDVFQSYLPTLQYFGADFLSGRGVGVAWEIFYIYYLYSYCFGIVQIHTQIIFFPTDAFKSCRNNAKWIPNAEGSDQTTSSNPIAIWIYGLRILVGGYFFLALTLWSIAWS